MRPSRPLLAGLAVVVLAVLAWRESTPLAPGAPPSASLDLPGGSPSATSGLGPRRDAAERAPRAPRESASREPAASGRRADFDFYLLSLTLEPAFCDDGNQRIAQCRALDVEAFERTPLVLHGLWPEAREPGRYPRDCPGPRLDLQPQTRADLGRWMPGIREGLERHEWRTHGTCSGLDDDAYFRAAIDGTRLANEVLGDAIRGNAGRSVDAATLRRAAERLRPGFGSQLVFVCRTLRSEDPAKRRRPHLLEVRLCVDADGPGGGPGRLLRCADVDRRDQGCGGSFMIDAV